MPGPHLATGEVMVQQDHRGALAVVLVVAILVKLFDERHICASVLTLQLFGFVPHHHIVVTNVIRFFKYSLKDIKVFINHGFIDSHKYIIMRKV